MALAMRRSFAASISRRVSAVARSGKIALASEFWAFLRVRKKWWLAPIVVILALFGSLIVFSQGSALAPFIYTIF
jgi:hypothetical protein